MRAQDANISLLGEKKLIGSGTRRVHQDGVIMLDKHLSVKDSSHKIEIMQNRVKRLLYEEERARKLSQMAKMKADKMLEARERHQKELTEKFRYYENRKSEIANLKDKNLQLKQENKERIYQARDNIYKERIQNKDVQHYVRRVLEDRKSKDREEDISVKKTKKFSILIEKN